MSWSKSKRRFISFEIKGLNNQIRRALDCRMSVGDEQKLTGMHHGILGYLSRAGDKEDVFQKDIEREFNIRRSTATGIVQLMEKNGYIERKSVDYDARLKKLIMTEKAKAANQRARENIDAIEAAITRGLTDEEIETFHRILAKMMENVKRFNEES